eukprot:7113966-Pyramimonas_sp.AAC.1
MSRVTLRPCSEALNTSNDIITVSCRRCIAIVQPGSAPAMARRSRSPPNESPWVPCAWVAPP